MGKRKRREKKSIGEDQDGRKRNGEIDRTKFPAPR